MDPKPTIRQIATATGYSKSTVSAALRNNPNISAPTRKAIHRIAAKMGYQKDERIAELMGYLSEHKRKPGTSPLLWLHDEGEREAWRVRPWYRNIFTGAKTHAEKLGFHLEEFWCGEPGMNRDRIIQILKARAVRGAILTRPYKGSVLVNLDFDFCACAQVQTDYWSHAYHVAVPANYHNVNLAIQRLLKLGYQRPLLAEMESIHNDAHGTHAAAYLMLADRGVIKKPSPIFKYTWAESELHEKLQDHLQKNKNDVVICQDMRFKDLIETSGFRVPRDLGLVHLNLADDVAGWSGIDPNHSTIGAAAVDLVVNQIHRNEVGRPSQPYSIHVKGKWAKGSTTKK